jgi:hypothetical protein
MPSEFEKVLDEIRKRSSKYEDIGDVKGEIIKNIVDVYPADKSLLQADLKEGGFDLSKLNLSQSMRGTLSDFFSLCNGLRREKLYKIFAKLYEHNSGISLLREIRDLLRQPENQSTDTPTYTPSPYISLPPISSPPIELPIYLREEEIEFPTYVREREPVKNTILEPNLDLEIYGKLEEYLKNEQWKEADLETMKVLIEIADSIESPDPRRDLITWLKQTDLDKIPDEVLKTIDQLWVKYSKGHFGFSVQAKIWGECCGKQRKCELKITYRNKFAESVGWSDGRKWIKRYDNLDFSIDAKRGHLPSLSFPGQKIKEISERSWQETFKCLLPRLFKLVN